MPGDMRGELPPDASRENEDVFDLTELFLSGSPGSAGMRGLIKACREKGPDSKLLIAVSWDQLDDPVRRLIDLKSFLETSAIRQKMKDRTATVRCTREQRYSDDKIINCFNSGVKWEEVFE